MIWKRCDGTGKFIKEFVMSIFKLGEIRNVKLTGRDSRNVYCSGAKQIRGERYVLWPQCKKESLPKKLTWNSKLHNGVEQLEIAFSAQAGDYLLELAMIENHIRRVRKGSNLCWDGHLNIRHEDGVVHKFDLQDKIIKRFIKEVRQQIESPNPDRTNLDFWLIDEIANQPHNGLLLVHLDGREVGYFIEHWPEYTINGKDEFRERQIAIPLVIENSGVHKLTIFPRQTHSHRSWEGVWGRVASQRLIVAGIELKEQKLSLPKHPLAKGDSRHYPADFFGWQFPIFYQRYDAKGVDIDYFKRVYQQAFHRGSNFVSVYMTDCNNTVRQGYAGIIPWPEEFGLEGADEYNYNDRSGWDRNKLQKLITYAQETGLLACWYTHLPHIPDHWGSLHWKWMRNYTEVILRQFANLSVPPEKRLQGLFYETAGFANDVDMVLMNELFWQLNPLMFFAESENERLRTTAGLAPFRIEYHATTDFGWEDKFPDDTQHNPTWSESKYGRCNYFGQMNCRDRKYSVLYGEIGPDAIVKQANDIVRMYNLERWLPGKLTGFEWISETPEVTSARNREMVYAVSSDPIVGALAFEAETYGGGGRFDQSAQRLEDPFHHRPRLTDNIPHTAVQLQNNYWRLSVWPGGDGGILRMDKSTMAHFDTDSPSAILSDNFLATSIVGSTKLITKNIEIKYRGPYLAKTIEQLELITNEPIDASLTAFAKIKEQRHYTMISDMPLLHLEIERQFQGQEPDTQTFISLAGYDEIRVADKWYKSNPQAVVFDFNEQVIVVRDSRGVLHDLAIALIKSPRKGGRKPTHIRWRSNEGLSLWWNNPKKHPFGVGGKEVHPIVTGKQAVECDFVLLNSLYTIKDVKHLGQLWDNVLIEAKTDRVKIKNKFALPMVKIVKVPRAKALPFWVKEKAGYFFRGSQPADNKSDFVKCYLPAGGIAEICRYGQINDIVKPAPGCQYAVTIQQVDVRNNRCTVKAAVSNISAAINPALDFAKSIQSVKVNGAKWFVYDRNRLYLPKQTGQFKIEISFGQSQDIHIIATQAMIRNMDFDSNKNEFSFEADYPEYTYELAPSIHFYAAIKLNGQTPSNIKGAKAVENNTQNDMLTIKFKKGKVKIKF